MNRRTLFRSLGLAAIVATLPKLPKEVVPEDAPPYTKELSESLPETPFFFPFTNKTGGSYFVPTVGQTLYTDVSGHSFNGEMIPVTFTSASTFTIKSGMGKTEQFVPPTGDEVFDSSEKDSPVLISVVYPPNMNRPLFSEVVSAERFFSHSLGGIGVELSNGVVLRRPDNSYQWRLV